MAGHHKFIFTTNQPEILTGLLSQYAFEAFSETDDCIEAWLPEAEDEIALLKEIEKDLPIFFNSVHIEFIPDQNWNATWEAGFEPVQVGDLCLIRAQFHDPDPSFEHEIVIDPKQAFGTGHHETTYMMIDQMAQLDLSGKRVLDFGCGTGILAIYALQLGASEVVAIDIEEPSVENTKENLALNNVAADVRLGSVETIVGEKFDVVLANVNRNTIMLLMPQIADAIADNGVVLFSGFLESNIKEVTECAVESGLEAVSTKSRGGWMCLGFKLPSPSLEREGLRGNVYFFNSL